MPDEPVTLAALLTDASGNALPGEIIRFQLGAYHGQSTTDSEGVARVRVAPTHSVGTLTVDASFAGDARSTAAVAHRALPFTGSGTHQRSPVPYLNLGLIVPPCVAPGMPDPIRAKITNVGDVHSRGAVVDLRLPDGHTVQRAVEPLAPHASQTVVVAWNVPVLPAKGTAESDHIYVQRLLAHDNRALSVQATLRWSTSTGHAVGSLERRAQLIETLPVLALGLQLQPMQLSPGQLTTVLATLQNLGMGNAANTTLTVTNPDGSRTVTGGRSLLGDLAMTLSTTWQAPALAPHGTVARDVAYLSRLTRLDRGLQVVAAVQWQDALGNRYGPIRDVLDAPLPLPILRIVLQGPGVAHPGMTYTGTMAIRNSGSATASLLSIAFSAAGASPATRTSTLLVRSGEGVRIPLQWQVPVRQPPGPALLRVSLTWRDALSDVLGPVTAYKALRVVAAPRQHRDDDAVTTTHSR